MRLLLLCLPLLAHAQIAGTVVDATNNTPLPGVKPTLGYATLQCPSTAPILRLSPESTISGRILNTQGPAGVTLTPADSQVTIAREQTDSEGRFHLPALPPGNYKLFADDGPAISPRNPSIIQLSPGEHKTGIEVTLTRQSLVTVRGRFNGDLPTGSRIFVSPEGLNGEFEPRVQGGQVEADGRFILQTAPGPVRLKARQLNRSPVILGYLDVTIPPTGLDNVQIPPSPIRTIRAKFRWLNNSAPVPGQPQIMLNPMERLGVAVWTNPGPDGTATVQNVSPDRYSILPSQLPPNAYVHTILAGGADISQRGLDLITGTATDLELLLATDGATITGRAPGAAEIRIIPTSPHRPERERNIHNATPDANGNFTITALAPNAQVTLTLP